MRQQQTTMLLLAPPVLVTALVTALVAVLLALPGPLAAQESLSVRPGSVVRWSGAGTERCTLMERSWTPIGDTCWYPIDLLMPEGQLTLRRQRSGTAESVVIRVGAYPYPVQELQVDDSKVHLSAADLDRYRAEAARIRPLWQLETPRRFTLPLAHPLAAAPSPSSFGNRRILNGEPRSPHSGVDFKASQGTPILAMAAGTVVLAEDHFFSGNSVFIDHGDGLISMSFHMERILVKAGQTVERGQQLGTVGATGRVTGPHLHLSLRWHGAKVDPGQLLAGPAEVPQLP